MRMTFVKDGDVVLSGRALQRNPLTLPGSREDRVREARLKKSERFDARKLLNNCLKGGAGDLAQALNKYEV